MNIDEYKRNFEEEDKNWYFKGIKNLGQRIVDKFFVQHGPNEIVLDIGCGTGGKFSLLNKFGKVIGIEYIFEGLRYYKKRNLPVSLLNGSGDYLPIKSNSVDKILLFDVIEHIKDDDKVLSEINRILKPGGQFLIYTSAFMFLWTSHDIANQHFRRYDFTDLIKKIEKQGLEINFQNYSNIIFFPGLLLKKFFETIFTSKNEKENSERSIITLPKVINYILVKILDIESFLVTHFRLPFGVSIVVVGKK
jgi:ubiquinone/menaquinone biosynthesis C-methylase UbiE